MNQVRKYWLGLIMIGGLAVIAVAGGDAGSSPLFPIPLDSYGDADLIKSGDIFTVLGNVLHIHRSICLHHSFFCLLFCIHLLQ